MQGRETRRGESRGRARGRASGVTGHAAVATTGLSPPPPSPRPGGQGRRQHLMPRGAAEETRPDPPTLGPARTLKLSSLRHERPGRRPPAPLLSGLFRAQAQCRRPPRLNALWACACVRARSAKEPAQAHKGTTARPLPLPRSLKGFKRELSNSDLPPRRAASRTEGLPPLGCAHAVNMVAVPRHGII